MNKTPVPPTTHFSRRAQWAGHEPIASALMARAIAQPELISLAAGFVDPEILPVEATQKALAAVLASPEGGRAALQYGTTLGHLRLRDLVLRRLLHLDGCSATEVHLSAEQVVLTAGSNELLYLVSDVLLDPGDIVLAAAPTYYVYLGTLANVGARVFGIEVDRQGLIPEAVEDRLRRLEAAGELSRVKAIYVNPDSDNPTGATLPPDRRAALVQIARRWSKQSKIYVIEDAAYRELRYTGDDISSVRSFDRRGDTVIHAGTFSKSFAPGVRVGWGILPQELVTPVRSAKANIDFGSPHLNQHLMAVVLEQGLYDRHVERLRKHYRLKLDATLAAAQRWLRPIEGLAWNVPCGGLYVWITLPPGLDAGLKGPLFDQVLKEGMIYIPAEACFPAEGAAVRRNALRLSFGIPNCEQIEHGVAALARAIERVLPRDAAPGSRQ